MSYFLSFKTIMDLKRYSTNAINIYLNRNIKTTLIYTHVSKNMIENIKSPLDSIME